MRLSVFLADHPRSRGVYTFSQTSLFLGRGSSPLARGLPRPPSGGGSSAGIIPARAGFTRGGSSLTRLTTDHPRSRGVYTSTTSSWRRARGSSPLARGLRVIRQRDSRVCRIIPARAGFTASADHGAVASPDHPRSRGVYFSTDTVRAPTAGSSPLARGLLIGEAVTDGCARIIPARAGFTGSTSRPILVAEDHPRSRGVYASLAAVSSAVRGSSPLARGLRRSPIRRARPLRIIPARAGFTIHRLLRHDPGQDHPRSREVYSRFCFASDARFGSSPLARGLPCDFRAAEIGAVDHPRSRGVYA